MTLNTYKINKHLLEIEHNIANSAVSENKSFDMYSATFTGVHFRDISLAGVLFPEKKVFLVLPSLPIMSVFSTRRVLVIKPI